MRHRYKSGWFAKISWLFVSKTSFCIIVGKICLQFTQKDVYCFCKVDIVRKVLRLGKSVNESAHLYCDTIFSPLQKS